MPSDTQRFNPFKAYFLLFLAIFWTLWSLFLYLILTLMPFYNQRTYIPFYHVVLCRLLGVEIIQQGDISTHASTMFVSNHVSYLDIPVLGNLIKNNASFVAKSEIASWPFINRLAKIQNTIFIERKASKAKAQTSILRARLAGGDPLILFPEGTSTNGAQVLPLKSSLFSAAEADDQDIYIQPVSIVYAQHNGKGMDQKLRDHFAWYADFPFGAHFFKMLGMGTVTVVVTFSEPVRAGDFSSRKECAAVCEEIMRKSFEKVFMESGSSKE